MLNINEGSPAIGYRREILHFIQDDRKEVFFILHSSFFILHSSFFFPRWYMEGEMPNCDLKHLLK